MPSMRLGILEIGGENDISSLVETLRGQDIDVVTNETPVTNSSIALQEGARLGRADCDGVLLCLSPTTETWLVLPSVLHLICPLLLSGVETLAKKVQEELHYYHLQCEVLGEIHPASVFTWLEANRKTKRQPGIEAAHKLYGLRLALPQESPSFLERQRWFHQFGIVLVPIGEEADIVVTDHDAMTAFCLHFLKLLASAEPVVVSDNTPPPESTTIQLVQEAERFILRVAYGARRVDDIPPSSLVSRFICVPGDHKVALIAACHTLDVACFDIESGINAN